MLRIFAISSQVAYGHVGLAAILPAIQSLGHEVLALPTVMLSNHPGHRHFAGERISPATLKAMAVAMDKNGWLTGIDRVLTGYLPSTEHVAFAADTIARIKTRSPAAEIICDPVIGDAIDGIYIDIEAAEAIRDRLLPVSDLIVPNNFELSWLAGTDIGSEADILRARQAFPGTAVLATSVPTGKHGIMANVFSPPATPGGSPTAATSCRFTVYPDVPKGTGDFFSGLIAAGAAFNLATAQTSALAKLSMGKKHLDIAPQRANWIAVEPLPIIPVNSGAL